MNKAKHYIDWINLKATAFLVWILHLLEVYDKEIDLITKNIGRIGVIIGVGTVFIRFIRTLSKKGSNGD